MKQHWQQQQQQQQQEVQDHQNQSGSFGSSSFYRSTSKWYHFKIFNFASSFRGILFWKSGGKNGSCSSGGEGYTKLDDEGVVHPMIKGSSSKKGKRANPFPGKILASAVVPSYSPLLAASSNENLTESMVVTTSGEDQSVLSSLASVKSPTHIAETAEKAENAEEEEEVTTVVPSSYRLVDMLPLQATPRPVLIYGPFSHVIAARLETAFPDLFRVCSRKDVPINLALSSPETASADNCTISNGWEQPAEGYTHCTTTTAATHALSSSSSSAISNLETLRCIALGDLADVAAEGRHAVISVVTNTVADFRAHSLFPIVVGLRFRSAKHLKETVNRWKLGEQLPLMPAGGSLIGGGGGGGARSAVVGYKMAKTSYAYQLKLEAAFGAVTDVRVAGNNIAYMCTQIKDRVGEEQSKVLWRDLAEA